MTLGIPKAHRLILSMTSAALLVGAIAPLPLRGQRSRRDARDNASSRTVVLLDGYVQTRFEQDEGKFGLSRLAPPVRGHSSIWYDLPAANDREKEILEAVNASHVEYLVEFVHCAHIPGSVGGVKSGPQPSVDAMGFTLVAAKSPMASFPPYSNPKAREEFHKSTEEPLEKQAMALLPRLQKGETIDTSVAGWHVAFRPVRASKASCIRCHAGTKGGDTLGIMLYAVRPAAAPISNDLPVSARPGS
jgi:hypothetical protein